MGAVVHDRAPHGVIYSNYVGYLQRAHAESGKPVALVASRQGTGCDPKVVATTHAGFPVLDGIPAFLHGVRALFAFRDFSADRTESDPPAIPAEAAARWRDELNAGVVLDEVQSLELLRDFGISTNTCRVFDSETALAALTPELTFPVVLKTAMPGLMHKTEQKGVVLDLGNEQQLVSAYRDLASRLGPRALISPMVEQGIEMILGSRRDPQFGPVVLLGFGGVYAEALQDVVSALPPFDKRYARRRIDELKMRALLDGQRGNPPCDIDAFCDLAARFSGLVHELRDSIEEIDINPVIVSADNCIAVDALIVGRRTKSERN